MAKMQGVWAMEITSYARPAASFVLHCGARGMSKRYMEDYERDAMIDSIQCRRDEPTEYIAPEPDQKWRARNVISFHFRYLGYKAPSGYRDVLLCAIDHANPTTGRC